MTTLSQLRDNAQGPFLFTDAVADGVLADVGLAAQELPEDFEGGALTGYLHQTDPADHDAFIRPEYRSLPTTFKGSDLANLREALLVEGAMQIEDVATTYGRGTSLSLQNIGFCPVQATADDAPSFYDYGTPLGALLAEWPNRPPFVNCGDANNFLFLTGSFHTNNKYGVEARADNNPFRAQTLAQDFGVTVNGFVRFTEQVCADNVVRYFPKTIYDPTNPTIAPLTLAHCAQLATQFGTQLRYMCHGESVTSLYHDTLPQVGEPPANVAVHVVDGFRAWLQAPEGLNLTLTQVNTRWGTGYSSFASIDPRTIPLSTTAAIADYRAFQSYLLKHLGLQQYRAAKAASPTIEGTRFSFGTLGVELSGHVGEFAAVGDWQAEAEYGSQQNQPGKGYRETGEYLLRPIADTGTLSGNPACMPITSPTFTRATSFTGQEHLWPINRAGRNYTTQQVMWLARDAMRAKAIGIGYLFGTPNFSFGAHAPSRTAVLSAIDSLVAMHAERFALCSGHSRIVLHVDPLDATNFRVEGSSTSPARCAYHVHRLLRDRTIGSTIMHETEVMERPHVRATLERSITVIPWHSQIGDLVDTYASLLPAGSTGSAVVIHTASMEFPEWAHADNVITTPIGTLHNIRPASVGSIATNCWLYLVRPRRRCEKPDIYLGKVAKYLADNVLPLVESQTANSFGTLFLKSPVIVDSASSQLATNYVTDGIDWTVAVSNMGTTSATAEVRIESNLETSLDVSYPTANITLAAGETQFVTINATTTGIDVQAAIDDAQAKLALMAPGYAASVAQVAEILDHAEQVFSDSPSRALAGYIAAVRAPLVSVSIASGVATVTVQRLGIVGAGTSETITGATVLVTWPLALREHGPSSVTDGSGVAAITLGAPSARHYDFETQSFVGTWGGSSSRIEVQVTDPRTCASTRVQLANS